MRKRIVSLITAVCMTSVLLTAFTANVSADEMQNDFDNAEIDGIAENDLENISIEEDLSILPLSAAEDGQTEEDKVQIVTESGSTYFPSVAAAIAAATDGEETVIELLDNVTESMVIPAEKNIVLDLKEYTLTGVTDASGRMSDVITNNGTLTIRGGDNGAVMGGSDTGQANNAGRKGIALVNKGLCTIESGTIRRGDNETFGNYVVQNIGTMYIKGGLITNNSNQSNLVVNYTRTPEGNFNGVRADGKEGKVYMEILGGTLQQNAMGALKNDPNAKMKITGDARIVRDSINIAATLYGEVEMDGGTISGQTLYCAAWKDNGGEYPVLFNVIGGTVDMSGDVRVTQPFGADGAKASMTISGADTIVNGKVYALKGLENGNLSVTSDKSAAEVQISGGTFNTNVAKYCIEGYELKEDGNRYVVVAKDAVAKVGDKSYYDLQKALDEAESGAIVTLLADIAAALPSHDGYAYGSAFTIEKNITLDGAGHTITIDTGNWAKFNDKVTGYVFNVGVQDAHRVEGSSNSVTAVIKDLTIKGNSEYMRAGINAYAMRTPDINAGSTNLTLQNVNISDCGTFSLGVNNSTVTVENCNLADGAWKYAVEVDKGATNLKIKSGTIGTVFFGSNSAENIAEITGGTITGVAAVPGDMQKISIYDGIFHSDVNKYVVEGLQAYEDNGIWTIGPATSEEYVARFGNRSYKTLAEAFAALNADKGDEPVTMTILRDCGATANEQLRIERANVVIEGVGAVNPTITLSEFSCSGQAGILIGANNVTLKNLSVISTAPGGVSAVKATYLGAGEAQLLTGCVLENLNISSEKGHGLNLHGVNGCVVKNVTVSQAGKCGLSIANAKGVTVEGSKLTGTWGDIGMMYGAGAGYENPCDLTLGANNEFGLGLIYADKRADEAINIVTLQAEQSVDIFGAQVAENGNRLTTKAAVAKTTVGDKTVYYADLKSAVADAQSMITLLSDVSSDINKIDKNIDLNGKTLILTNPLRKHISADMSNGTVNFQAKSDIGLVISGDRTMTAVTINALSENDSYGMIYIDKPNSLTLVNSTVNLANNVSGSAIMADVAKGKLVLDNTKVNIDNTTRGLLAIELDMKNGSVVTIQNCNDNSMRNVSGVIDNSTLTVTGGENGLKNSDKQLLTIQNNSKVSITGATGRGEEVGYNVWLKDETDIKVDESSESNFNIGDNNNIEAESHIYTIVAKIGEQVYYDLQSAIEDAQENAVITLLKDFETNAIIDVNKSITIDGLRNGERTTITSTANRVLWISQPNVTVNLKNIEFVSKTAERGVQVNVDITGVTLNIDNCVIPGTYYAINMCGGTNTDLTITNSTIAGWCALNLWGHDYTVNVSDSTLIGLNDKGYNADGWNDFTTIILEGDTTGKTTDHVENCHVVLNNCHIVAEQTTGNKQKAIGFNLQSKNNSITITGDKTVVDYEDNLFCIDNGEGNKIEVHAGTFPTSVCGYVAATAIQKAVGEKFVVGPLGENETTEQSHLWDDGEETKAASCTEKGSKKYTCTVCGVAKVEEISLLPHTEVIDEAVAATCTTSGKTAGKHCSVCNEVLEEQTEIAPLGHTEVIDEAIPATCTTAGKTAGKHCSVCETVLTAQEEIAPLGHTEAIDEAVAATCTTAGKTEGKHCSVCNEVLKAQEEIAPLGHDLAYTAEGNVLTETCKHNCGHSATATITAAGGTVNGENYVANVAYGETWLGDKDTEIIYTNEGREVTSTREVGRYTASITLGEATARVGFRVTSRNTDSNKGGGGGSYRVTAPVNDPNQGGETEIDEPNVPLADAMPFVDVVGEDWFYDSVQYAYLKGMMNGVTETEFAPGISTTRGMITTILYRLEGEPEAGSSEFTDVEDGQYYAKAVAWAAANGIVTGYGDGTFGPNNSIVREQMAAILYRYAEYKGYDISARTDLSAYTDAAQISAYAVEAMQWAVAKGLLTGVTEQTLEANGNAVRAQIAAILNRFCENIVPAAE